METATKRLYEALFLVDAAQAASDWDGTMSLIEGILKRANAEVQCLRKWCDRRLTYPIGRVTRGTYILSYFKADSLKVGGIEKDVQLSEKIMRVMLLCAEERPADWLQKDIAGENKVPQDLDMARIITEEPPPGSVEAISVESADRSGEA